MTYIGHSLKKCFIFILLEPQTDFRDFECSHTCDGFVSVLEVIVLLHAVDLVRYLVNV